MPETPNHVCVSAVVLPSMRKDRIYNVTIFLQESSAHVVKAYCVCPTGLSGYCNHVTATLYCLTDYIHSGLQGDEQKGCTECSQTWNPPRKRNVDPRPTDQVQLAKKEYGIEKRPKAHRINQWDCWPLSRRIIDSNKARKLKESLSRNHEHKIAIANHAVSIAQTTAEKKRANQTKLLLERYGSSCYLQLLNDQPAPAENHLEEIKRERLARAAEQKRKFLNDLLGKQHLVKHDHTYTSASNEVDEAITCEASKDKASVVPLYLVSQLYENQVDLNLQQAADLEMKTITQSSSELWHNERKLHITASIMKEVCHRKANTNCKAFVHKTSVYNCNLLWEKA